ncbi:hypothetical protein JAAARDRAFT_675253 [Jaapia argillacea MUCL 33604]|uniref:F-box domain-containing protein n=1 Tax=Jaapia argillacea MUCL 33604 TaxID=933084 RepID=A0A067PXN0_9AGAM|nr:hypothetical protein JAAARDRAFT_675253 [Jaapia argillacea MUCL 33604]
MSLDQPPVLPQELVDNIIDHLYSDTLTLRACALTSRRWLHTARYHIFHRISIRIDVDLTRLLHLLQNSPHIPPYIHILSLIGRQNNRIQNYLLLQQLLPNIDELILQCFELFDTCDEFLDLFYNHFTGIKSLQLLGCTLGNANYLVDLLSAKPNLESILLRYNTVHYLPDPSNPVKRRALPQLKSISTDSLFTRDPTIEKTLIHGSFPCLHTLDLEPVKVLNLNDFESVTALLKKVSPTLVNLSIPLRIATIQDTMFEQIQRLNTFSNIPQLRSLYLYNLKLDKESTSGLLPLILSQLQPSSLNIQYILVECACDIDVETIEDFNHVQWTQIDEMFHHPHFGSLKVVMFQIRTRSGPPDSGVRAFGNDFRDHLPYLKNRGVLRVVLKRGQIRHW